MVIAMPQAGEQPIPLKEAAKRVLQFCSAREAAPIIEPAIKKRRIRIVGWRRIQGPQTPTPDTDAFYAVHDPETGHDARVPSQFPWEDDALKREVRDAYGILHSNVVWGPLVLWSEVVACFRAEANLELPDIQEIENPVSPLVEIPMPLIPPEMQTPSTEVRAPDETSDEPTDSSYDWVIWRIEKAKREGHIEGRPLPQTKTELSEELEPLLRAAVARHPNSRLRLSRATSIEGNFLRRVAWPPLTARDQQ